MDESESNPPIILVDDLAEDLSLTERLLRQCKVLNPVISFSKGNDCIAWFEEHRTDLPVLVLLDLIMYPTSGVDVLSALRDSGILDRVVVVMLSGIRDVKIIHQGYQLGAKTFLIKPLNCEDLMQMINALKTIRIETNAEGYILRSADQGMDGQRNGTTPFNSPSQPNRWRV